MLAWDLGQFIEGSLDAMEAGKWSIALALTRLAQERTEYLIAAHEDASFAIKVWEQSDALETMPDEGPVPRVREGLARGIVRKWAERQGGDPEGAERLLRGLIHKKNVGSLFVHPSTASIALAYAASRDPAGADARFVAFMVAGACGARLFRSCPPGARFAKAR